MPTCHVCNRKFKSQEAVNQHLHDMKDIIEHAAYRKDEKHTKDVAYVLDYLPLGSPFDRRPIYQKKPIVQGVEEKQLVLIEMIPKEKIIPKTHDMVYIGDGDRPVIDHIKRRIAYNDLTNDAQTVLPIAIKKIVLANESHFLSLY